MYRKILFTLVLFVIIAFVSSQLFCFDLLQKNQTKYYPVRHCQRSNKTRIAAKNVDNVKKCAQFAATNNAMAFNYGHGKMPRKKTPQNDLINLFDLIKNKNETKIHKKINQIDDSTESPYFNCEVLSCPESGNMSSMINDTRYDYYTMYGNGKFIFVGYFILASS